MFIYRNDIVVVGYVGSRRFKMNITVLSIIVVILIVSAVTVIFPENKYKNHLILMTKIIVVVVIITAFPFSFKTSSIVVFGGIRE